MSEKKDERGEIISGEALGMAVCEAMGIDPHRTGRIILDLGVGFEPVKVYVEMIGDDRLLSVDWSKGLKGAVIMREAAA